MNAKRFEYEWPEKPGVNEVLEQYCKLQEHVYHSDAFGPLDCVSSDCICSQGGFWASRSYNGTHAGGYRNDGRVFARIVACVNAMQGIADPERFVRDAALCSQTVREHIQHAAAVEAAARIAAERPTA